MTTYQYNAIQIAASALNWVILQLEKEQKTPSLDEHILEKHEALKILNEMLKIRVR